MAQDLVEPGLEIEQLGGAVEARHHRLERVLFVEEAVLVRPDDACAWGVGDQWPFDRDRAALGAGGLLFRRRQCALQIASSDESSSGLAALHHSAEKHTTTARYWRGQSGPSFTASFRVQTTHSNPLTSSRALSARRAAVKAW